MVEIFFEEFGVPKFFVELQAILSLYSTGRVTGFVLDSGDGVTHTVPVFEGYSLKHSIERQNLAGRDITHFMQKLLREVNPYDHVSFDGPAGREMARKLKEELCYVALDYKAE